MKKITILVSSKGKNVDLGNAISEEISKRNISSELINLVDLDLPLYTTEEEVNGIPDNAKKLASHLKECQSFVVVAPEYNGSVPPVLINAISWVSRTGDDWREAFNGKMALIATHSGGGGAHVLMALRSQLSFVGANVIGRQILTNYSKELNIDSLKSCIDQL